MAKTLVQSISSEFLKFALEDFYTNTPSILKKGTSYEVLYKGKSFPPKEIIRRAAKLQGIPDWESITHKTNDEMIEKLGQYLDGTGAEIRTKRGQNNPIIEKIYKLLSGHPLLSYYNDGKKNIGFLSRILKQKAIKGFIMNFLWVRKIISGWRFILKEWIMM